MSPLSPAERLIVALDVAELDEALDLIRRLKDPVGYFKVGLALFTRVGPQGIARLKAEGIRLFLDLKFHDIPAVVGAAAAASSAMGADMITVHVSGGTAMMRAAAEGAGEGAAAKRTKPPTVLGVTVLTSLDRRDLADLGYGGAVEQRVREWALLARQAGLGGLVASAREAADLRHQVGPDFIIVTPGIRPAGEAASDQKRTATPAEAVRAGADYLVVGRPVIAAPDPAAAARAIIAEIGGV